MDTKKENFIKHLELIALESNVFSIQNWGESILTDLKSYYGSGTRFEDELKSILKDYERSSSFFSDSYAIKLNHQKAESKIRELLRRIIYSERSKPELNPVKLKPEEKHELIKEDKSELATNIHDNHPEKRVYNFTLNQILGILTFFVGLIGGGYLLGKDNGAKYSERDFQKKDDIIADWQDSVKARDSRITYLLKNSDSAAQLVPTLRYDTFPLSVQHKQIVQHYMESVYEALLLNKK